MGKRFELFEEELEYWIHDYYTSKNYGEFDLCHLVDLLNEQDKTIKLLTEYNKQGQSIMRDNERLNKENQQLKQSQNSKLIEVLEKVKNFYNENSDYDWIIDCCELEDFINNQITELRGKKND